MRVEAGHTTRRTCPRCGGHFLLDYGKARCPHCGKWCEAVGEEYGSIATYWISEMGWIIEEFGLEALSASLVQFLQRLGVLKGSI